MPVPSFSGLPPYPTFDDVVTKVNQQVGELRNLLLNLDSLNIKHLTADLVDTGTLNAGLVTIRSDLTTGFIQIDGNGMRVNNGSYDTFTVDINGNVSMTGAHIRSQTSYPRVDMDPSSNYFRASDSATNYTEISYNALGAPSLHFNANSIVDGGIYASIVINPALNITSNRILNLVCGGGYYVQVPNWSQFRSLGSSTDLQTELNNMTALIATKATAGVSTGAVGDHNHGVPSGTVLMVSGGGTVTFVSSGGHSHTQV